MAFELLPVIVVDPITLKTFRQSKRIEKHGRRKYRRARRILPGLWYTYRNTFLRYPEDFRRLTREDVGALAYTLSSMESKMQRLLT
jgi:hypothetical protein